MRCVHGLCGHVRSCAALRTVCPRAALNWLVPELNAGAGAGAGAGSGPRATRHTPRATRRHAPRPTPAPHRTAHLALRPHRICPVRWPNRVCDQPGACAVPAGRPAARTVRAELRADGRSRARGGARARPRQDGAPPSLRRSARSAEPGTPVGPAMLRRQGLARSPTPGPRTGPGTGCAPWAQRMCRTRVRFSPGGQRSGVLGCAGPARRGRRTKGHRTMTRPPRFPFGRAAPGAPDGLPHVVVVGAGFAGHAAARGLLRRLRGRARITVIDQQDHFVYLRCCPRSRSARSSPAGSRCR